MAEEVISTQFEERLREEMRHATTGVSAPSGLVRRARRDRRRRMVTRASAACAAAAVAVAGLREYLACGTLRYEGKQQVDGVNALKLVSVGHQRQGKTLATIITIICSRCGSRPGSPRSIHRIKDWPLAAYHERSP
jgi:hypothetical protein